MLNGMTVPPDKAHPRGTLPLYKTHPGGTVPPYKTHPRQIFAPYKTPTPPLRNTVLSGVTLIYIETI